jgi:hypothetical protein
MINLLYEYFLSRYDIIPVKANGRIFPCKDPIYPLLQGYLDNKEVEVCERLKGNRRVLHKGTPRCGTYTLNSKNFTKYACIDLDGKGHSNPLVDPKKEAIRVYEAFLSKGLSVYPELSFSGKGYHLWILFEEPIEGAYARQLCQRIVPKDLNFSSGKGEVEIFPKQEVLSKGGLGNFVFLPTRFISLETDEQYIPEQFKRNSRQDVLKVIQHNPTPTPPPVEEKKEDETIWSIWRKKCLALLDIPMIYGKHLTGRKNGEWLECKDPWSLSGDSTPSAGVSSGHGEFEPGTWHSFISGETLSIFDFLRKAKMVKDTHMDAVKYVSALTGIELPNTFFAADKHLPLASAPRDALPVIITNNRQFRDIVEDSWAAIEEHNETGPHIFIKSNHLATIMETELRMLSDVEVHGLLGRIANWAKLTNNGMQNVLPVKDITKDVANCEHEGRHKVPPIQAVINTPIFSKTRELVYKNGYSESAEVWLNLSSDLERMGEIPQKPTDAEVDLAKSVILDELLINFPLVSQADISHVFAAMILPFVRQLIDGPTPLHVIEAPTPGTGKSKLCNLISITCLGKLCESSSLPGSDEEIRKMLTAELVKSKPIVLLDNVSEKKRLDSAALAALLTSVDWTDRVLGETKMTTLKNFSLWMLTANNPQLTMELARRSIRIRLDAKLDQPWRRKEFKHPYIEEWAKNNRMLLVKSILILVQKWISLSCPLSNNKLGSFERWSAVIGGILEVNGIGGFLENLEELYESSDVEGSEWRSFVIRWYAEHGTEHMNAAELYALCENYGLMSKVLGLGNASFKITRIRESLRVAKDRVVAKLKINISKEKAHSFYLTNIKDEVVNICTLQNEMAQ